MKSLRAALMTAVVVVLASGCSSSGGDTSGDADAKKYYDTYSEQQNDSASGNSSGNSVAGSAPRGSAVSPQSSPLPPSERRPNEPGPLDDNTFVDAGTSGFVDPREQPRSTFAVDVDGGSFRVARTLLHDGHLPPPESVRAEEWVNSFDSGFPSPRQDDLELRSDQGQAPSANDGTRLVRIGLQGREVAEDEWRPVALTMVVDTSGSMDVRERLGLVKSSLALLVQHLRPSDTIAIVTYETNATPLLEPTPVRDADTILSAIDRLRAGGSTNLEAGLLLGYDQAREAYKEGATNVVLLASDGVANVGVTDGGTLASAIRDNGRRGIHLVTVGYGMGNYNDHLMEQLADQGDGFYEYVDTYEEARKLFVEDLRATLTPVAKDAKIQVEFDPRTVSAYRLIGYENRALADEDFDNDAVDAGEVGAGHKVTALYEVRPTAEADEGDALGTVRVRWRSVDGDEQREDSLPLTLSDAGRATGALGVAAAVADLAQLVKSGNEAYAVESRGVEGTTLESLQDRVSALVKQEAPGAREARRGAGRRDRRVSLTTSCPRRTAEPPARMSVSGTKSMSAAGKVCRQGEPGPASGPHGAGQFEKALDPIAVPGIGLEQLRESVVVHRRAGQRPADVLGHVVVPEAHRICVPQRPMRHLVRGPPPHTGHGLETTTGLEGRHTHDLFETTRASGDHDSGTGAGAIHPGSQPLPGRDESPGLRVRRDHEAQLSTDAWRGSSAAAHQSSVCRERLFAGHSLFDDGRDERLHDEPRCRNPPSREATSGLPDHVVVALEAGVVIVFTEEVREPVEDPFGALTPRLGLDLAQPRMVDEPQGRRPRRHAPGEHPRAPSIGPRGRIAAPASEDTHDRAKGHRSRRDEHALQGGSRVGAHDPPWRAAGGVRRAGRSKG